MDGQDVQMMTRTAQLRMMEFLTVSTSLGFFAVVFALLWVEMPQHSHDVLLVLFGSLGTAWMAVISYFFGSSAGSANKDANKQALFDKPKEVQP